MLLRELQAEHREWVGRQPFKDGPSWHSLLGIVEEVGELCHAHLKAAQGIRGTPEELDAKAKDAVGDVMIYLLDYCSRRGWSLDEIVHDTWAEVKQRDWERNRADGVGG